MNIIYISNNLDSIGSGAGAVSFSNFSLLRKSSDFCFDLRIDSLAQRAFDVPFISRLSTLLLSCLGFSGGLSPRRIRKILSMKKIEDCDCIWLDSSLYGRLGKLIKKKYPSKKIITFFHNVEYDFIRVLAKKRGFLFYPVLSSSCYNERLAVKYSDYILTLTKEDSNRLGVLYGRAADLVLPVVFDSAVDAAKVDFLSSDLLFVGSDFPPNIEALEFLAKKVMPFVNRKLIVIGKGLDKYRDVYGSSNVQVIGYVEDVAKYYQMSNVVMTPIFSGAGMKVKVAEALSFGKIVLGTKFSFVGYEKEKGVEDFMICAETSEEYIELLSHSYPSYYSRSNDYFDNNYSTRRNLKRIEELLSVLY
jgi:polysaccharide biosynthesis protein PslH